MILAVPHNKCEEYSSVKGWNVPKVSGNTIGIIGEEARDLNSIMV